MNQYLVKKMDDGVWSSRNNSAKIHDTAAVSEL